MKEVAASRGAAPPNRATTSILIGATGTIGPFHSPDGLVRVFATPMALLLVLVLIVDLVEAIYEPDTLLRILLPHLHHFLLFGLFRGPTALPWLYGTADTRVVVVVVVVQKGQATAAGLELLICCIRCATLK